MKAKEMCGSDPIVRDWHKRVATEELQELTKDMGVKDKMLGLLVEMFYTMSEDNEMRLKWEGMDEEEQATTIESWNALLEIAMDLVK